MANVMIQNCDGDQVYTIQHGRLVARATRYAFNGTVGLWTVESPRRVESRIGSAEVRGMFRAQGRALSKAMRAVETGRI